MYKDKRIIIVEDEPIVALDFQYFFLNSGYTNVSTFLSGKNALNDIEIEKPDLALLDIKLKDAINGLDVAEVLKENNVPFIFISAFEEQKNYHKALSLKPAYIFSKPIDMQHLLRIVNSILVGEKVN